MPCTGRDSCASHPSLVAQTSTPVTGDGALAKRTQLLINKTLASPLPIGQAHLDQGIALQASQLAAHLSQRVQLCLTGASGAQPGHRCYLILRRTAGVDLNRTRDLTRDDGQILAAFGHPHEYGRVMRITGGTCMHGMKHSEQGRPCQEPVKTC